MPSTTIPRIHPSPVVDSAVVGDVGSWLAVVRPDNLEHDVGAAGPIELVQRVDGFELDRLQFVGDLVGRVISELDRRPGVVGLARGRLVRRVAVIATEREQ